MSKTLQSILVAVFTLTPLCSPLAAMDLVRNGQPAATVVVPDKALPVVTYAAEELVYHLERATGAKLPVATESERPQTGALVFLGDCRATAEAGILPKELKPNEWIGKLAADRLYLAGDDSDGPAAWIMHNNRTRVGTLFAVYELLERELGVKWLWPGELGLVIPSTPNVVIESWDDRGTPAFIHTRWRDGGAMMTSTDGWSGVEARSRFLAEQGKWLRRHRFAMGRNMDMAHAYTGWWHKYSQTNPNYFNLLPDGTRRSDPGYHGGSPHLISMSVGHAGFQEAVVEHWLKTRSPAKPWIDCSENDTAGKCICEDCLALDEPDPKLDFPWNERVDRARAAFEAGDPQWVKNLGSMSDRYARFYLAILERARQHDPEAVVMGYAYANAVDPPHNTQLDPNVIIGVVPPMYYPWTDAKRSYNRDQWQGWSATGARMFLRPNWMLDGHNMPLFLARKLGTDFKFYADHGLIGTDFDSLTGQFSTQGPNLYMLARLHADPTMTVEEVFNEFYTAFGVAEPNVRAYFEHWETVVDEWPEKQRAARRQDSEGLGEKPDGLHWSHFYRQADLIFTPEVMARGRQLIEEAARAALGGEDETAQRRVGWLEKGLTNAEMVLATQRAYNGYRREGDFEGYRAALAALDEFRLTVEADLIANFSYLAAREGATWDRKMVEIMKQPGTRLPDPWKFAWDPDNVGRSNGWHRDDFNVTGWLAINTDSPWEEQPVGRQWKQDHENEDYNGPAWYRTSFEIAQDEVKSRVQLVFGAVDEACTIWVNGQELLERPYPYLGNTNSWREAFEVDITEVVRYDRPNTVAVRVSDNAGAGGIYRPVWVNQFAPQVSTKDNLLPDPGFEEHPTQWKRSRMAGKFDFSIDSNHSQSGKASARIECTERASPEEREKYKAEAWGRWYTSVSDVNPEKTYRLRLWARTPAGFRGRLAIWVTGTTEGTNATNLATTNGRWHEVIVEGLRPKEKTVGIYLNLLDAPGTAWFDDIELVEE